MHPSYAHECLGWKVRAVPAPGVVRMPEGKFASNGKSASDGKSALDEKSVSDGKSASDKEQLPDGPLPEWTTCDGD